MNKVVIFLILYGSLFILEIFILLISLSMIYIPKRLTSSLYIEEIISDIGFWAMWIIFYLGGPFIILFILFSRHIKTIGKYKPMIYAIFNLLTFIVLNFIYGHKKLHLDLPNLEFHDSLFSVTCISIFLSPLILGQIPYYKKLMEEI